MKFIPRDYQEAAHDSLYSYFASHPVGNPLIALPTGTGKAVVIAMFIERALKAFAGQRIMVLTHVKELIEQNYLKLKAMWPGAPAGIYSSGLDKRESHYPVTFAGIQSVKRRSAQFGWHDLILIDEAHLVGAGETTSYIDFINKMKAINPALKIIGFTATSYRVGMGSLTEGKIFNDICFDLTDLTGFNWLLNQGYMKPLVPQPTHQEFDLSGVKVQGGEYNQTDLQDAFDQFDLNRNACREMLEKAHDRKHWLIFAAGVEHAMHVSDMLDSMGISSIAIHSKMGGDARDKAIREWKSGKYRVAVNNNVLTTGVDFPEIDFIGMLRATKSTPLWVQMLGRGTRPVYAPGPDLTTRDGRLEAIYYGGARDCLVLDFAGNTPRLGPVNDPVLPKAKGSGGGGGSAPVKLCPACGTYCHASLTICSYCGHEMPRYVKLTDEAGTQELIKKDTPPAALPIVETYEVERVTYQRHQKDGRPDSIKVTYYCKGYKRFTEWVCPEHEPRTRGRAISWWRSRTELPDPATTDEALEQIGELTEPVEVRVRTDLKYPEVVGYGKLIRRERAPFTGQAVQGNPVPPQVGSERPTSVLHQLLTLGREQTKSGVLHAVPRPSAGIYDRGGVRGLGVGHPILTKPVMQPGSTEWNDLDDDIPF